MERGVVASLRSVPFVFVGAELAGLVKELNGSRHAFPRLLDQVLRPIAFFGASHLDLTAKRTEVSSEFSNLGSKEIELKAEKPEGLGVNCIVEDDLVSAAAL